MDHGQVKMRHPDPSTKMLRSGFGGQVRSTSPSEPAFGFGTGVRDAALKVGRGGLRPQDTDTQQSSRQRPPGSCSGVGQNPQSSASCNEKC
jgi:hypothetical protein